MATSLRRVMLPFWINTELLQLGQYLASFKQLSWINGCRYVLKTMGGVRKVRQGLGLAGAQLIMCSYCSI
jgi:hypothetical protein